MILRGEDRCTQKRTCPVASFFINYTYTDLGSNPVLYHENPFNGCRVLFRANRHGEANRRIFYTSRCKSAQNVRYVVYRNVADTEIYVVLEYCVGKMVLKL
jgi:hypothetical protein